MFSWHGFHLVIIVVMVLFYLLNFFVFSGYACLRDLHVLTHSFPTRRSSDQRAAHSAASTSASSVPVCAQTRTMSPSRILPIGPPPSASGLTWIAQGTLPDAPDIRPSVTKATRNPRFWSTPRGGVSLCNSGMPLSRGPWKRTTTLP